MPPITLATLADRFLEHCETRLRPRSLAAYQVGLRRVTRILGPTTRAGELTTPDIDRLVTTLKADGATAGGVNAKLRVLKAALRWAVAEDVGLLRTMPRARIRLLPATKKMGTRTIEKDGIEALLRAATSLRDRALLLVLAGGGLRIDEALHLRWGDLEGSLLTIRAKPDVGWTLKNHAERAVDLPPAAVAALRELRAQLPEAYSGPDAWVFQRAHVPGERVADVAQLGRALFRRAGLYAPRRVFHELRRGAASAWLRNGADIATVKELLGHSSIEITQRYLYTQDAAKKRATHNGLV